MSEIANHKKIRFWKNWTLINAIILILSYIIGIIVMFLIAGAFQVRMDEWGSPFEQILEQIGAGAVIGLSLGITQMLLLRKLFNVSSFWVYSLAVGFIITELILGIILWRLDINRGELRFIEGNSLPDALIHAIIGFIIGLIQLPLLKPHFSGIAYWVIASTLAWGSFKLVTAIPLENGAFEIIAVILGTLLYGAITGLTIIWLMKPKAKLKMNNEA